MAHIGGYYRGYYGGYQDSYGNFSKKIPRENLPLANPELPI